MMNSERVFAVVCDRNYFPGLLALLNSLHTYHGLEIPVYVFEHRLSDEQLQILAGHPLSPEVHPFQALPFPSAGTWEAKQQVPAWLLPRARCVYLLDADLVLTSQVEDIFRLAETGKIVSSTDGAGTTYGPEYSVYHPSLPGRSENYFNSGALCLDVRRHWDLISCWAFSSQYGAYSPLRGEPLSLPGHGDQGLLNAIAHAMGKTPDFHALPEDEWCDSTRGCVLRIEGSSSQAGLRVRNETTGKIQRLVHSTGPKWWTPAGRLYQATFGDKLVVFEYFGDPEFQSPAVSRSFKPNGVGMRVSAGEGRGDETIPDL